MENLLSDGMDFENISDALRETSGLGDRLLQIKRNTGFTGGDYNGVAEGPTYVYFNLPGTALSITQVEAVHSGGMLSLGDLRVTFWMNVLEKGEGGDGYTLQESDVLIYDQKEWHSVAIPERVYAAGGITNVNTYWRRT